MTRTLKVRIHSSVPSSQHHPPDTTTFCSYLRRPIHNPLPLPVEITLVTADLIKMGGLNLEVFKFGMYVMFPIGIMFYFGTNLDQRFTVPDFWPKPENANKVPFDREEIHEELERLRARRLYLREKRLASEGQQQQNNNNNNNSSSSSNE
ncbi:hypothetical protein SMACR_01946 [Sordaria macrospora]|nr:hypothetical protein SMACR_01946 [Sordaria macrospora]WPJ63184.1 hypothetical protein SMAC4_01946 [Sordaria macrospora]